MNKFNFLLGILLLFALELFPQTEKNYIVGLNRDTVFINIVKVKARKVICETNDRRFKMKILRVKFKPKDILALKYNGTEYESGKICPNFIGFKHWFFIKKVVDGKMGLYEFEARSASDRRNRTYLKTINYFRKRAEPRGVFHKYFGFSTIEKCFGDCKKVMDKLDSKENLWEPTLKQLTIYYNENCN